MKIYYSDSKKSLVYVGRKADSSFWDEHWNSDSLKKDILAGRNDLFVYPITKKFLKPSSSCRILEGGCGKGSYVYSLFSRGYDAYGIDYAKNTVDKINGIFPELKVTNGDVRSLPFEDGYFNGYWSLGVIEHFWEGYEAIAKEMARVVKKGGYLFLTFPHLSPRRQSGINSNRYPILQDETQPRDFYQFALDAQEVKKSFEKLGFTLRYEKRYDGLKGALDDARSETLRRFLYNLYNTKNSFLRLVKLAISMFMAPRSGHIVLLVLQKEK